MAGIPLTRKLRILAQVAGQHAGSSRTMGAVCKAGQVTLRSFGRVLHQLWLEVTGFVFLVLAAIGGVALNREYVKYQAGHGELSRLALAIVLLPDLWLFRRELVLARAAKKAGITSKRNAVGVTP